MRLPFIVLVLLPFGLSAQVPAELADEFQEILNTRVDLNGDRGCAAAVILPDGSFWNGFAGEDKVGADMTDSTVFHGASCTKTHTATCMMLLAEEGLVNLDAPWSEYVTLNVDFDPNITIRQLLNNTSGIADYLEIAGAGATAIEDPEHFFTPEEILEEIVDQNPDFPAGSDFHYSTSNFVLAGLVIEAVTGNPLYDEMKARIWDPLGLEHTYGGGYQEYTEPRAGVWWNFGFGFNDYNDIAETSMLTFGYGGSGIVSTPPDQVKFIHALLGGNLVADTSLAQMHEFIPESYDDWSAGYGMGIHHAINVGADQVIGVDGYYTNMSSTFHSETDGFSIATMTNTQTNWYGIFSMFYSAIKEYLATTVEEVQQEPQLSVYPIPARDVLSIKIDRAITGVNLIDLLGNRKELEYLTNEQVANLNLQGISAGYYTLEITYNGGSAVRAIVISGR